MRTIKRLCPPTCLIHSGPDENGKFRHTRFWCAEYQKDGLPTNSKCPNCDGYRRSQEFNSPLPVWMI